MKKDNSNTLVVFIILILLCVMVFFLPEINQLLGNGNSKNDSRNGTYECELVKNNKVLDAKVTKNVVFTIKDGDVEKYVLESKYVYNNSTNYNSKKNETVKSEDGITHSVKFDDEKLTYNKTTTVDVKLAEVNNIDYPIKQSQMEFFVKEKGYKCSYKK